MQAATVSSLCYPNHVLCITVNIDVNFLLDWICLLGPQNFGPENLYAYAVVSTPRRTFNYVLARDVDDFNEVCTHP